MILYLLYRMGVFLACTLPLGASYRIACFISDIHFYTSGKDRRAVINNLKVILGEPSGARRLDDMAKDVFRNFAKYLVDFFRFSMVDKEYISRSVRVAGLENVDKALSRGKGVIIVSAHLGNWELGGFVLSLLRHPMKAVVLTHQNKKVNSFFTRQRSFGNMRPVEIGISLRSCYDVLKQNGLLALLGDRDFSKNGFKVDFFGKMTLIPKGPALFSYRMGSCIVPCFMVREADDSFELIFEAPIMPETNGPEDASVKALTVKYSAVIESYVRRYPTQWYMFRNVWNNNEKDMRPDTVI